MLTENWSKSSLSNPAANCLEARTWIISSKSGDGNSCVEVMWDGATVVATRNSNYPEDGTTYCSPGAWNAFLDGVRGGEFNV